MSGLKDVLAARGWLIWQDSSGNTFLQPRLLQSAGEPAASSGTPTQTTGDADLRHVQALLGAQNWRVARDLAGNILLFPVAPPARQLPVRDATPSPPPQAAPPAGHAAAADFDRVQQVLAGYGWELRRDDAGNLILIPLAGRPVPQEHEAPTVMSVQDARALLATRGWDLATDSRGNWLLTPRAAVEPKATGPHAAKGKEPGVSGTFLDRSVTGELKLPVDTSREAATLAEAWLKQAGKTGLVVGAIRRISEVYLVSIVTENPPHHLRNQLAIRSNDGLLVPLLEN